MFQAKKIFGAFLSERIHKSAHFYGTGETFLFYLDSNDRSHVFEGTGKNESYIFSDDKIVAFGCSDGNFSLCLEQNFLKGHSSETATYMNRCLSSSNAFYITKLEFWVFE